MTQLIQNIEDYSILPGLRNMLQTMKGVSIVESAAKDETKKTNLLNSITKGIQEVQQAKQSGHELPLMQDLIQELKEQIEP